MPCGRRKSIAASTNSYGKPDVPGTTQMPGTFESLPLTAVPPAGTTPGLPAPPLPEAAAGLPPAPGISPLVTLVLCQGSIDG